MTAAEKIMVFGLILELLAALPAVEGDIEGAIQNWHADTLMSEKLRDAGEAASKIAQAIAQAVESDTTIGGK